MSCCRRRRAEAHTDGVAWGCERSVRVEYHCDPATSVIRTNITALQLRRAKKRHLTLENEVSKLSVLTLVSPRQGPGAGSREETSDEFARLSIHSSRQKRSYVVAESAKPLACSTQGQGYRPGIIILHGMSSGEQSAVHPRFEGAELSQVDMDWKQSGGDGTMIMTETAGSWRHVKLTLRQFHHLAIQCQTACQGINVIPSNRDGRRTRGLDPMDQWSRTLGSWRTGSPPADTLIPVT